MGARAAHQPHQPVPLLPRGRAENGESEIRPHRQHRLGRRQGRQSQCRRLFRFQGRRHLAHQVARQGARQGRRAGQLRHAGGGEDGDLRPDDEAAHRLHAVQDSDGALRRGRRDRRAGLLARERGLLVLDRRGVRYFRRKSYLLRGGIMRLVLLAVLAAFSTESFAQQKLKFAHVYETSEPYHTYAVWAAGELAKRTGNRYTMDVFPASQLGNETQINQSLSLGTVDLIYTGQAFAARTFPPLSIGGAPYMFRDFDHWKKYSESTVLGELMDGYFKKGNNKPIAAFYYGVRHTTANKAINKPEDMKGLKLRVPDAPLYIMYPKIAGANATPIAFAEVYLALQNKTVDAQENPLPTILAKKFYEVQTHINLTGHITEMLLAIVGGHVWSKLSEADKKTFEAVFREAAAKSNAEIAKSEQQLVTDFATKYGKTVVKSDREAFKKVFAPFLVGSDVPWDKALYDKVQAIK